MQSVQINTLSIALADTPKISQLDFNGNDGITEKAKKYIDRLIYCQLEASRKLADDKALGYATFLSDVKWPEPKPLPVPPLTSVAETNNNADLGRPSLDATFSNADENTQVLAQVMYYLFSLL